MKITWHLSTWTNLVIRESFLLLKHSKLNILQTELCPSSHFLLFNFSLNELVKSCHLCVLRDFLIRCCPPLSFVISYIDNGSSAPIFYISDSTLFSLTWFSQLQYWLYLLSVFSDTELILRKRWRLPSCYFHLTIQQEKLPFKSIFRDVVNIQ